MERPHLPICGIRSPRLDLDAASTLHAVLMTSHTTAIEVAGIAKSYGDHAGPARHRPHRAHRHRLRPARAQRRRQDHHGPHPVHAHQPPTRARPGSPGSTSGREPDGVRRSIGVTGQFSAIDELLTGRENLRLMADLAHLPAREARRPGRRAAGPVRPDRRRRPARRDVLRRHEAPARPRHDAGEPPAADLPRRTDHRARPAQPPRPVADRRASCSPTA